MVKKLTAVLLTMCMAVSLLPMFAQAASKPDIKVGDYVNTDCYATVLNTVEVVCDAEGSADLVLSSVSLTDIASVVEFTVIFLGELCENLLCALV